MNRFEGHQEAVGAFVPKRLSAPPPPPPAPSGRRTITGTANLNQLRAAVDLLQQSYDTARAEIAQSGLDPLQARTYEGRYVLLDALTALVNAKTMLFWAENANGPIVGYVHRDPSTGKDSVFMADEVWTVREARG